MSMSGPPALSPGAAKVRLKKSSSGPVSVAPGVRVELAPRGSCGSTIVCVTEGLGSGGCVRGVRVIMITLLWIEVCETTSVFIIQKSLTRSEVLQEYQLMYRHV